MSSCQPQRKHFFQSYPKQRVVFNDCQVTVTEDYCGSGQSSPFSTPNSPLVGNISLESSPVKTFLFTQLTSLVSTGVDNHTVIVTTTATGYIIKVDTPCFISVI